MYCNNIWITWKEYKTGKKKTGTVTEEVILKDRSIFSPSDKKTKHFFITLVMTSYLKEAI